MQNPLMPTPEELEKIQEAQFLFLIGAMYGIEQERGRFNPVVVEMHKLDAQKLLDENKLKVSTETSDLIVTFDGFTNALNLLLEVQYPDGINEQSQLPVIRGAFFAVKTESGDGYGLDWQVLFPVPPTEEDIEAITNENKLTH
jgi:hypothetical protein